MSALAIFVPLAFLWRNTCRCLEDERNAVCPNHDVFVGFRGPDTRTGFVDFLFNALVAANFDVFKDDRMLPFGEQIGPELSRAIGNSRIAIPIISKQYSESIWCLTELTMIMRRYAKHGLLVFPVFYEVDVFDVLHQTGDFGNAFTELVRRYNPEEVRVQEWRESLRSVARIGGWTSRDVANGCEGELVEMVLAKVCSTLRRPWIERLPMFSEKRRECQVFLTFSPDLRKGLAAYLHFSLEHANISVFSSDDQSLIGKDFAHEIRNAIDSCSISIPILSENFASSSRCLGELVQMVECKTRKGRKMLPIFHEMDPSQVREVSHCFQKDMRQHKVLHGENTYNQWEEALRHVGDSRGLVSENIDMGNEVKLAKLVIEVVSAWLKNPKHDPIPIH